MAMISKEFTNLFLDNLERSITPVFEEMSEEQLLAFLEGVGPALEADPFLFPGLFNRSEGK